MLSIIPPLNNKNAYLRYAKLSAIWGILLLFIFTVLPLQRAKADTFNYVPICANTALDQWDWPKELKDHSSTAFDNFSYDSSSYIIYKTTTNGTATPKRSVFEVWANTSPTKFSIGYDEADSAKLLIHKNGSAGFSKATIVSEHRASMPADYYKWPSGYDDMFVNSETTATTDGAIPQADINCIVSAKNVLYESTWEFNEAPKDAPLGSENCSPLEFGCWIGKAFNGIADTFQAVGEAIVKAIAWLWVPDGDYMTGLFNQFLDSAEAQFGFLSYPITYLSDLIDSFDSSSSWCTESSCTKSFGSFFGGTFAINFLTLKTNFPDLWTYIVLALRGTTILALIFAIRHKYMEVLEK